MPTNNSQARAATGLRDFASAVKDLVGMRRPPVVCCVLATMLGAIDWGFRVILVTDALCSSADETHDAMMDIYLNRFGEQVETVTTDTLHESWRGSARARKAS